MNHPLIEMYHALDRDPMGMIYNGYDIDLETAMRLETAYDNPGVTYVDFTNLVWQEVHPGSVESLERTNDGQLVVTSITQPDLDNSQPSL